MYSLILLFFGFISILLIFCQAMGTPSHLLHQSSLTGSSFLSNGINNSKIPKVFNLNKKLNYLKITKNKKNNLKGKLFSVNPFMKNNFITKNENDNQKIKIRLAKTKDAKTLHSLIQELADYHDMSNGVLINAEQMEKDLNNGFMHSLIAIGDNGEMAAYAVFYFCGSSTQGQIIHLEDLYIRPQFRRKGIGFLLLEELAKIAYTQNIPFVEWQVARSNYGAIKFYKKLPGLIDETDGKEENKFNLWRLSFQSFDNVLQKASKQKENNEKLVTEIYLDDGQISESNAFYLADEWHYLIASQKETKKFLNKQLLAKLLNSGLLGAIVVKEEQKGNEEKNKIVGMAFFHRKGYSTWQGRFPILDNIFVVDSAQRKGIGTEIMSELVKIAQKMKANKIQWETNEISNKNLFFFKSLNANNLTENEGWLIYRWYYNQQNKNTNERKY